MMSILQFLTNNILFFLFVKENISRAILPMSWAKNITGMNGDSSEKIVAFETAEDFFFVDDNHLQ